MNDKSFKVVIINILKYSSFIIHTSSLYITYPQFVSIFFKQFSFFSIISHRNIGNTLILLKNTEGGTYHIPFILIKL
jgi:hypothetical protein